MCCCCCPPAITALFCLWAQSGCRKGTVAGALTFFPPDPPLYQYERHAKDGRILAENEEAPLPDAKEEEKSGNTKSSGDSQGIGNENTTTTTVGASSNGGEDDDDEGDGMLGDVHCPQGIEPLEEVETKGQTKEKMKSPIEELTEQAAARRRRAKQRFIRDSRDAKAGVQYKLLLDSRLHVPSHEEDLIEAVKIPWKKGDVYVAAVVYRLPVERRSAHTKTIIYSHGNATDLGAMFPVQVVLSHSLDCNVVVYDYSGYGESGGVPEEGNSYKDIDAVYQYTLKNVANNVAANVVLYGQSVGSGPCCYLAAKNDQIGGLVLHSPFTSGMRVLTPSRVLACLDIYPNIDRIKHVNCPVMVIHGRLDQEVDISHGVELHRAVPRELRREPWWVPDRGHNDITDGPGKLSEYIRRLRTYLESLDDELQAQNMHE